jgi:hypothetical protein
MSPPKTRRQQMKAFEDQALEGLDELFRAKTPLTPAQVAAESQRMVEAFRRRATPEMQEVFAEVALISHGKTDHEVVAELFRAFHARGIEDFTPGEHSVPVVRVLADGTG